MTIQTAEQKQFSDLLSIVLLNTEYKQQRRLATMNNYIFKTKATMKEYNAKKYWIDSDIVREYHIEADNVNNALKQYAELVNKSYAADISKNALKTKSEMYIDTADNTVKQIGYVLTAKTLFDKGNYSGWTEQFIDLWVEIITTTDTVF